MYLTVVVTPKGFSRNCILSGSVHIGWILGQPAEQGHAGTHGIINNIV
jgi:hypothetical protein